MTATAKGTVYGGTVRLSSSPDADMHGYLRAVIRTHLFAGVMTALSRFGLRVLREDLGRTWSVSTSAVEQEVTLHQFGELFTCPWALAYLRADSYRHHPFPRNPTEPVEPERAR